MRRASDDRPRGIGSRSVLVVEDDESIGKLLRIVLEQNGYVVTHVGTYEKALSTLHDSEPSIVVLDLGLPDGNGLDVLKWIREQAGLSVPVLVLSAFRQDDNVQKAFELGANDFMSKPFRPKELVQRLQRVMEA